MIAYHQMASINRYLACVNSQWKHGIGLNCIQQNLDQSHFGQVWEEFFKFYTWSQDDIRNWPNADCGYAGIITQGPCKANLVCEKWSYQWKDSSQFTCLENLKRSLFGQHSFNGELLSYLSELMKGEPCPNCGIIIIKISGCPHMVCQKCSYEFCWDWLGYYKDYQHLDGTPCPLRVFIIYPLMWFFLFWMNFKLCYSFTLLAVVQKAILCFAFEFIMSTLILMSLWIEVPLIDKVRRYKRYRPNYRGLWYKVSWLSTIFYPFLWASVISKIESSLNSFLPS